MPSPSVEILLRGHAQRLEEMAPPITFDEVRNVVEDRPEPLPQVRLRRFHPAGVWVAAASAVGVLVVIGLGFLLISLLREEPPPVIDTPTTIISEDPTPTTISPEDPTPTTTPAEDPTPAESGGTWRTVAGPGPGWDIWIGAGAAYDAESDLIVTAASWAGLWGGGQLWFDTNTGQWASLDTVGEGPSGDPRAQVYDPVGDRVIMVTSEGETLDFDVDTNTWTDLAPTQAPSPGRRNGQAMVYDAESGTFVMFGGGELTVVFEMGGVAEALGDTWTYDPAQNVWDETQAGPSPPARVWPTMAYDSQSDRVVLFGGAELAAGATLSSGNIIPESWRGVYGDTWVYDTNTATWTEMQPPISPSARAQAVTWYDPDADLVFLYGGTSRVADRPLSSEMFGGEELWAYDLDTNTWTLYQVDAPNPGLLVSAEAAFDTESGAAVVFEGFYKTETGMLLHNTETWIYQHSGGETPD